LLEEAPWFAEVWRQRSLANAGLGRTYESMQDSRETLARNPYHFAAAMELGESYLQLGRAAEALACYELALDLHPGLERARLRVARLRRQLGGGSREA
jgi:tetratricopeptide (TPR) repeat protein